MVYTRLKTPAKARIFSMVSSLSKSIGFVVAIVVAPTGVNYDSAMIWQI